MGEEKRQMGTRTLVVHAGERRPAPRGVPASTPVYATTTFTYETAREMDEVFADERRGYVYTRYGNPTVTALEEAVRLLEDGAGACAFASGMAALHASLLVCGLAPGATVLASRDLYGSTSALLHRLFGQLGVETVVADFSDTETLARTVRRLRPRVLVAETISNPLLRVCDLEACARAAHEVGARLLVDNTFATPYLCRPLAQGADVVVHSATKYLGGHGDVTGGVAVTKTEADCQALSAVSRLTGGVLGVWEAHEVLRGIKTLAVRVERQCANARALAERLTGHAHLARVYYPTLAGDARTREVVARTLREPFGGALVTVELREATREAAFRFMDALRLCVRSTSLGDVFTGVLHPASASHREVAPEQRRELGITDGVLRISVGLEDVADIIADVEGALAATNA